MPHPALPDDARIEAELLRLLAACAPGRSLCPGDAARALLDGADDGRRWQSLLGPVRRVALRLAERGALEVLRKGRPVPPAEARGVLRLRLPPGGTPEGPGVAAPPDARPRAHDATHDGGHDAVHGAVHDGAGPA